MITDDLGNRQGGGQAVRPDQDEKLFGATRGDLVEPVEQSPGRLAADPAVLDRRVQLGPWPGGDDTVAGEDDLPFRVGQFAEPRLPVDLEWKPLGLGVAD